MESETDKWTFREQILFQGGEEGISKMSGIMESLYERKERGFILRWP
jgi:hypothetical protein